MSRGWPTVSGDPLVQLRYEDMRAAGESHSMAEVLATRSFPGVAGTDSVFMQGRPLDGSQFHGQVEVGDHHRAVAARAGVNTAGKYHLGTLARYPGDPRAWVSGRSDVKAICESEGWSCDGAVKVEAPKYADGYVPPDRYTPSPKLVGREVARRLAVEPRRDRGELAHEVAKEMAGVHGSK